jgi:hypothetical protein
MSKSPDAPTDLRAWEEQPREGLHLFYRFIWRIAPRADAHYRAAAVLAAWVEALNSIL